MLITPAMGKSAPMPDVILTDVTSVRAKPMSSMKFGRVPAVVFPDMGSGLSRKFNCMSQGIEASQPGDMELPAWYTHAFLGQVTLALGAG